MATWPGLPGTTPREQSGLCHSSGLNICCRLENYATASLQSESNPRADSTMWANKCRRAWNNRSSVAVPGTVAQVFVMKLKFHPLRFDTNINIFLNAYGNK